MSGSYLVHEVHAAHGSLSRGSRDALAPYKTAPRPRISLCHPLSRSTTSAVVVNRQRTSACAFHSKSGRGLQFCVREMRKAFSRVVCCSPSAAMNHSWSGRGPRESIAIPAPTGELPVGCIDLMHQVQQYLLYKLVRMS